MADLDHSSHEPNCSNEAHSPLAPTKPPPADLKDLTDSVLAFLSTASNESLATIAGGLALCTYFLLGRLGLLLIGILLGIIAHATWQESLHQGAGSTVRRENGVDLVARLLDWRAAEKNEAEEASEDDSSNSLNFDGFQPDTAAALDALVDAIIRDYVKWWYSPIVPNDTFFPAECRKTLTAFLLSISSHPYRTRPADKFLDFLTNTSSTLIVFLNEINSAFGGSTSYSSASEAIENYLSTNPDCSLATILSGKQQKRKFRMVAEDILENFLEKSVYNCGPSRAFLRELLAGVILESSLTTCSKPEWINGWIVYLLEEGEPEISQALDAGLGTVPSDELDGNVGNIGIAKTKKPSGTEKSQKIEDKRRHKKQLSQAEEAMEEAMEEAKRLSRMIAEEEAKNSTNGTSGAPNGGAVDEKVFNDLSNSVTPRPSATPAPEALSTHPSRASSEPEAPESEQKRAFTSFDQIGPPQPGPLSPSTRREPLTLTNAKITIHDDSNVNDKGKIRSKPTGDYLIQIEPASSQHPGWMIVKRYPDFEVLHEVLRRIATVAGVTGFTEQHGTLPSWKKHTKPSLRGELERYLNDSCWYQQLAESEGMKRFLGKEQEQMPPAAPKGGFGGVAWPGAFENVGKGMMDVATGGGKVVLGGVTGVIGNIGSLGQKKAPGANNLMTHAPPQSSTPTTSRPDSISSVNGLRRARDSEDSLRMSPVVSSQPAKFPPTERRPSYQSILETESETTGSRRVSISARSSRSGRNSMTTSREPSLAPSATVPMTPSFEKSQTEAMNLPPPPSDMPDDYGSSTVGSSLSHSRTDSMAPTTRTSMSSAHSSFSPKRTSSSIPRASTSAQTPKSKARREAAALSEQETRVAVELMFAVINELYTLSSAWNIRRTLLNAAKTFLLRPGNPSLTSIQTLIQDSIIASNTSDAGIASHLRKLRENTLPTEEELKTWPKEMSSEEKERLRLKARKLLMERGLPTALTGVMGQAATAEAMGKVFDCLQVEEVARGLIFGLLLQGVRAVTH